ncbi:MAG: COQ9 family protein [Acetobacteraceae bacterium]|nr:COQ9 family protein [Acetobacteraceae bacterium]
MISAPERSAERDGAIDAILVHVPFDGWTSRALLLALAETGLHQDDAALLFPGGAGDLVEAFCDLADRRMVAEAAALDPAPARLPDRVRLIIALRLSRHRPHKEAVRRAVSVLALPQNARIAAVCGARTIEAIWQAAGDKSADFSWYTKRASLAAIYGATLLFWLRDAGPDDGATLAFLDRRLADLGRIGGLRRRAAAVLARFTPPALRPAPPA